MGSSAGPFAGTSFPFSSAQPYGAEGFADAAPLAFAAPELEDALFGSALAEDAPSAFAAACISSRFFWRPASEDDQDGNNGQSAQDCCLGYPRSRRGSGGLASWGGLFR